MIVGEWLLLNAKWVIFLAISWREQATYKWDDDDDDDDKVRFVLDQHAEFYFFSARSLKQ